MDVDHFCTIHSQKENLSEEKQNIVNFYKNQINTYDNVGYFSYWDILYKKYDVLVDKYFRKLGIIVDIGCGTGLISKKLTLKKYSVFGIDIFHDFLLLAKEKCDGKSCIFVKSIAEKIPIKENIVRGVICIETMDHIKNIEQVFSEISRICKKNGVFIFDMTPQNTLEICNILKYIYNTLFQKNKPEKYVIHNWNMICDDETKKTITIYKHNLAYIEKLLVKYNFNIVQKYGMHISSVMLFPENFQVSNRSSILFLLNKVFSKIDEKILNRFSFFQKRATCLIYVCKKY